MGLGTQGGSPRVPSGHGAFPPGRSYAYGQGDEGGPELARKASFGAAGVTVPQTDTGG